MSSFGCGGRFCGEWCVLGWSAVDFLQIDELIAQLWGPDSDWPVLGLVRVVLRLDCFHGVEVFLGVEGFRCSFRV